MEIKIGSEYSLCIVVVEIHLFSRLTAGNSSVHFAEFLLGHPSVRVYQDASGRFCSLPADLNRSCFVVLLMFRRVLASSVLMLRNHCPFSC